MNLENYNPEGAKNEVQLQKEIHRMEETLESLRQERTFLEKAIEKEKNRFEQGPGSTDFTGEENKERERQRQKQQEDERAERAEQDGLKIGNFNINSLDKRVKYGVGFGLILLCALVIYWFMKELSVNKDRDRPKKSK